MPYLNKTDDLVVLHNDINSLPFRDFTSRDFSLFAVICCHVKNKGREEVVFSFDELTMLAGITKHYTKAQLALLFNSLNDKLKIVGAPCSYDGDIYEFRYFDKYDVNPKAETVTVRVSECAQRYFNDLKGNFTTFSLRNFCRIDSKYVKTIYRMLRQFRSTGRYIVSAEKLHDFLGVSMGYKMGAITRNIIAPAIEELGRYFKGLAVEYINDKKRKNKVNIYRFTFAEAVTRKKPENTEENKGGKVSKVIVASTKSDKETAKAERKTNSLRITKPKKAVASTMASSAAPVVVDQDHVSANNSAVDDGFTAVAPSMACDGIEKNDVAPHLDFVDKMNQCLSDSHGQSVCPGIIGGTHVSMYKNNPNMRFENNNYDFDALEDVLLYRG